MIRYVVGLLLLLAACSPLSQPNELRISPRDFALEAGNQRQLEATLSDAQGRRIPTEVVQWRSSNPQVVQVSGTGRVTAKAIGEATISASTAGLSDQIVVSIGQSQPSPNPPEPAPAGSISGTVEIGSSAPTTLSEVIPGEIIVKFKPVVSLQSLDALSVGGVKLQRVQEMSLPDTALYRTGQSLEGLLETVRRLQARPDVEYAQPNYRRRALFTPNDPYYRLQWHYSAIRLPEAWDLERGTTNPVTVAVIDSGIYATHPDLNGKLLPGYDFVSFPDNGDGNGRDPDPEDPNSGADYHGTHVAGTIAAASNNRIGLAGVSFGARILPVRALAAEGGSTADVVEAMLWAGGLGQRPNPNPAQVLNLSLGGEGGCSRLEQEAINRLLARGITIVVAAGNDDVDASGFSPANCSGVITVGATDAANRRAPYSNFGNRIDVMAPGGNSRVDQNRDGYPDGVLSLFGPASHPRALPQDPAYVYLSGTSMAAPHVAGVVALMKSRQPSLTPAQILTVLQRTATPLEATACNRPNARDCGAGLINALEALRALDGSDPPTPTPPVTLENTAMIALFFTGSGYDQSRSRRIVLSSREGRSSYQISNLSQGQYAVVGWKDVNRNAAMDAGDYYGLYGAGGQADLVRPGQSGINVKLSLYQGSQALSSDLRSALEGFRP